MKKYKVMSIITLFAGLIQLTDAQASVRKGSLKETKKKGVYEITEPIQFKAGEEIIVEEGTLGRDQAECLEESGKAGSGSDAEKVDEDKTK